MLSQDHRKAPPLELRGGWVGLLLLLILLTAILWRDQAIAPTSETNIPNLPDPPVTTLLAVGDIMLSRHVSTKIDQAKNPDLPFEKLAEILQGANITFGNLECPLSDSKIPIKEGLIFRCLTKHFDGVINSGFDVLSTTNNHAMDQGLDNLEFTIDYLKSKNILPVGTAPSPSQGEGWPARNALACEAGGGEVN